MVKVVFSYLLFLLLFLSLLNFKFQVRIDSLTNLISETVSKPSNCNIPILQVGCNQKIRSHRWRLVNHSGNLAAYRWALPSLPKELCCSKQTHKRKKTGHTLASWWWVSGGVERLRMFRSDING